MSASWQQAFEELEAFISANKEIEISLDVVCLPDDVRAEFYRLFDAVRIGFVQDQFPSYLDDARELSRNYLDIKERVCAQLGLQDVEVSRGLQWLINDPVNALIRVLFDPLFDVLKHKIDLIKFERIAETAVKDIYNQLFREGYDRWVTLALIEALAPDEAFIVPVTDQTTDPELSEAELHPGARDAELPAAEKAQRVSFNHTPFTALLVPKAIVHSTKSNCFVSLCTDYHYVYRKTRSFSEDARWVKMDTIWRNYGKNNLWPDLGIYLNAASDELALVADYYQVARPDVIVEYMEQSDWYENGGVESVLRHYYVMQPRLGSFIVCREPVPEDVLKRLKPEPISAVEDDGKATVESQPIETATGKSTVESADYPELPDGMHLLVAGYDLNKLEPIVERILAACNTDRKGGDPTG